MYIETQKTILSWVGVSLVFFGILQFYPKLIFLEQKLLFWQWMGFVPLLLVSWHLIIRIIINCVRTKGRNTRQVAIIGATDIGHALEKIIERDK